MKLFFQAFFKGLYFFLTDKHFRKFVWLVICYGRSKRYVSKSIGLAGSRIKVADAKSFIWQYYEIFFKGYYDFSCDTDKPVILDCGANIGLSSIRFKQQYPLAQIHAFEPDDNIFDILKTNINNFGLTDVHVHKDAVWTKDEELSFASEGADGGKISSNDGATKKVNAVDFKRYLNMFERIHFLKIDIEGAETELLPHIADQLNKVDNMFVEFHSYNGQEQHLNEVIQAMCSKGHRIYIDNIHFKNKPFINKKGKYGMDLQLNIFAYKH
jgi:FkbM family methyltransferase